MKVYSCTSVKLAVDSSFFSEHSHIDLCLRATHQCVLYNSTSSIQWCNQIFHSPKYNRENLEILYFLNEILAVYSIKRCQNSLCQFGKCMCLIQLDELYPTLYCDLRQLTHISNSSKFDFQIFFQGDLLGQHYTLSYPRSKYTIGQSSSSCIRHMHFPN